jgi:hypothetical protein
MASLIARCRIHTLYCLAVARIADLSEDTSGCYDINLCIPIAFQVIASSLTTCVWVWLRERVSPGRIARIHQASEWTIHLGRS